jgi:hypothetical protein
MQRPLTTERVTVALWREHELTIEVEHDLSNPYFDAELWAKFAHESGTSIVRPAFWDGGSRWRVRFAPPQPGSWEWSWHGGAELAVDQQLSGHLIAEAAGGPTGNAFYDHGFWRMSPGRRSLVHADGTSAILVGDTAWALPWRATVEQVRTYAADRAGKGFNAVLLMTVQPDMRAVGPRDRSADEGFSVGFEDLPDGHINHPNVEYFQYLDALIDILVQHGLVPVLQPVFQGYGWKGLGVAGTVVPPGEYARYCRYLVARYGARPAIYLVGGDGSGEDPQVSAGGEEVHRWDGYGQPTGIHYRPHALNRSHQDRPWLDFQWCQTGHEGDHVAERVADMWRNTPVRAVANGEPTYEHTRVRGRAEGWWQGHEAWSNLCAGGTMGVVYGAASLWQWRLHRHEPGHDPYLLAPEAGWRDAIEFEGSTYVGLMSRILSGLPTTDMEPDWRRALDPRALSGRDGMLLIYKENGGDVLIFDESVPLSYRVVDPRTGDVVSQGIRAAPTDGISDPGGQPRVYICHGSGGQGSLAATAAAYIGDDHAQR